MSMMTGQIGAAQSLCGALVPVLARYAVEPEDLRRRQAGLSRAKLSGHEVCLRFLGLPDLGHDPAVAGRAGAVALQPRWPVACACSRVEAELGVHRVVLLLADVRWELKNESC